MGKLDKAERNLKKALRVRDGREHGGLAMGPRGDAAVSRDNMARLLEARGQMAEARAWRLKGARKGEIVCGANDVSVPPPPSFFCPLYFFHHYSPLPPPSASRFLDIF